MSSKTDPNPLPGQALRLVESRLEDGRVCVGLAGDWTLARLLPDKDVLKKLQALGDTPELHWDLSAMALLDSYAALQIWQAWGGHLPVSIQGSRDHLRLLEHWQEVPGMVPVLTPRRSVAQIMEQTLNKPLRNFFGHVLSVLALLGQLVLDFGYLLANVRAIPWPDVIGTVYDTGVRALGITALLGFLIGIVLSYLSALQLQMFGGEIFIINILGMSIIRELGPLLAAILVAGRSGSAMTAQIGIMRVTEELDALSAMGISHSLRLVLPKVTALAVVLPLLAVWTSAAALLGGILSAQGILDISYRQFLFKLPEVVPLSNLLIALLKSTVFGFCIALIACHFGFKIKPNTESLGNETTNSVVAAITAVIMMDAVFAILFMAVGFS